MNIQEDYRTPNRLNQKRNSSQHIIIRTTNALKKDRILKAVKEKGQVTYKGRPIRITPDFSPETMKGRRSWTNTDTKKTQMPTQDIIPSKTLNYHRGRRQSIP
uniref:L1 transposable element RRM domain-containing protein n=1 Tax=Mus spicilegus TaxID=10103 RepID=A0A8C6H9E7_MUSSI